MDRTVVTLFGPTASGKTALAIHLAQELNGVIINADSRQLYKHMPIIVAMPSPEEFAAAEHRLFNFLEPNEKISSEKYTQLVKAEVEDIWAQGKLPIICGGTGFYIKNLEEGISPVPALHGDMLNKLNQRAESEGSQALHTELQRLDPTIAEKLSPNDTQRVIRALGVCLQTGQKMSDLQKPPKTGGLDATFIKIALNPKRDWLYERIHKRFDIMMDEGLLAEVKNLKRMGFKNSDHAISSCGVKEFFKYIDHVWSLDDAKSAMLQSTRNYAKRQFTWLRGQYGADLLYENADEGRQAVAEISKRVVKS